MIRNDDVSDVSEVASGWRCLSVCRLGRFGMALLFGSERAPGDDEGYARGRGVCLSVCLSRCQVWWVFDHGKGVFRDTGLVLSMGHRGGGVE